MKNPWLKKNPLMSMWLSGAHKVAVAARGQAAAALEREATHASNEVATVATMPALDFRGTALRGSTTPKAKGRE